MDEYRRSMSSFSLCGLNCSLCPRYNTEGNSKCPGCGGALFEEKHPACAVITCSKKHGTIEFCFQCNDYPCKRYESIGEYDSFISYRRVKENLEKGKTDIALYKKELLLREQFLQELLTHYNDGRSKGFYCLASNDLAIESLEEVLKIMNKEKLDAVSNEKEKAARVKEIITAAADKEGLTLELRKESKK